MKKYIVMFVTIPLLLAGKQAFSQEQDNKVRAQEIKDGIYVIEGRGGNIGLSVGEDGAFMIDDKFAPMADNIKAKIAEISPDTSIEFVLNTHWHRDHTGGNESFHNDGSVIVSHENVRKRLESGGVISFFNAEVPSANPGALPMITFTDNVSFHMNGQKLDIMHVGPGNAHTDGDSVVFFSPANIVHTGDLYFNGFYPFIDPDNGGSVTGVVEAVDAILAKIDDDTIVIPGHGPVSNKAELTAYRDMLSAVAENISSLKAEGKSEQEIIAAKPTADFDEAWGGGFIKPDTWVKLVTSML